MDKTLSVIVFLISLIIIFGIYFSSSNFSFKKVEINKSTINDFGDENILTFVPEVCDRFYYEKDGFDWERNINNIETVIIGSDAVVIEKGDFNESCRGVYYYKNEKALSDRYIIVGNNLIIKANDISGIRWRYLQ